MSIKGNWPRENCTLLDKICWLYLGDLPEKIYVRAGDDFDPSAFGWEGVQPGKAVEMIEARERGVAGGRDARCGTADEPTADAAVGAPATDTPMTSVGAQTEPATVVSAQGDAPMQLRPLTFASREFWMLNAAFIANVICSYAVASFLAWNMDFFQMLMAPVVPSSIPGAFAAAMKATVWLTTAAGAVAAWRMWNRPSYYSLPRVLVISFVAFVAAELFVVDVIVYSIYFGLL